jgi:Cu/Ag efflux protein CusF
MKMKYAMAGLALLAGLSAVSALAQAPKPERVTGVIGKVDGHTVMAKSAKGDVLKLNLADKVMVVRVEKATLADIKDGDFIGSGAMPQPDGTQKAVEVHIFPEAMRGTGEGFRPWTQPGSTMTNGTVGATVTAVSGPVITVKYKGGEQKIDVPPGTPIVKYVIGELSDLKAGAKFAVLAALKQPDGSFNASRINVGP